MKIYKDFYYNGKHISDLGLIAIRNGEEQDNGLGLSREVIASELTGYRNKINIVKTKYSDTLPLSFTILKNSCEDNEKFNSEISLEELRQITSWLTSPQSAKKLIVADKEEKLEYYGVFTTVKQLTGGILYGLSVEFKCNAPYGFRLKSNTCHCDESINICIMNDTDELEEYIYPTIIIDNASGDYVFTNQNDNSSSMSISLKDTYKQLIIDCDNQIIIGDNQILKLSDIGWDTTELTDWNGINTGVFLLKWLRFVPRDNNISITGTGNITINYKIPIKTGGF